jgi:hypothetical protein
MRYSKCPFLPVRASCFAVLSLACSTFLLNAFLYAVQQPSHGRFDNKKVIGYTLNHFEQTNTVRCVCDHL